jgi:transcriptional regulator GlxA family with amidase domain
MPLLKIALTVAALLALGVIALVLLLGFRQKHQERALEKRQRRPRSPLLEQALQRVETEAADPYFSLDRLAGQLQTAPGNLERAFERELAVSFSRHLLLARIRNAKELLRDPEVPLAAVAHRAGFSDHQGFEKEFRRLTGTDPQTWREQRLEEDDEEEEIDDA